MTFRVYARTTREDGRPTADLVGPDHAFVRVLGALAHNLVEGQFYDLAFHPAEAPPAPKPSTPTIPLVQMALGGTVTTPKKEK
jgi:hypothetical protein